VRRTLFAGALGGPRIFKNLMRVALSLVLASVMHLEPAGAQTTPASAPAAGNGGNVEIDPIRCWTRSSSGAVRIGETFTVSLTCAVLETELVQVVPDESKLGVTVMQMNPFEVAGGSHPADLRTSSRRFFQYDYNVRMISPDAIGQDVPIPLIQVTYRINSRIAGNQEMQGRELSYVLPVLWVKVLSMVPADATDIRDTRDSSFSRIEQIAFRAGVLEIIAITFVVLGSIMTLLGLISIARRARRAAKSPQDRLLSRPAVMRLAARELTAAQRDAASDWTESLVNRAASGLRIAAAGALDRPVMQRIVDHTAEPGQGRFVVTSLGRGKRTAVSSSVTAGDVARAISRLPQDAPAQRRQLLEDLQSTLSTLSAVQYGRPEADRGGIDAAVTKAIEIARQVRSEHSWLREWLRRLTTRTPVTQTQR
jgi:hypothetical protein